MIRVRFTKTWFWDFTNGNSSMWIEIPFIEVKIKKNYKGHSIS